MESCLENYELLKLILEEIESLNKLKFIEEVELLWKFFFLKNIRYR